MKKTLRIILIKILYKWVKFLSYVISKTLIYACGGGFCSKPASSLSALALGCCSGTLLPSAKAYKAWVGCIFLWCGSKSQKLLMSLEGAKPCGSFDPRAGKLLAGLNKSSPTKRHFRVQCPAKVLSALGGNFWGLLRPHDFVTPKGTPLPLVVHSCLQLRFIRHEWDASLFNVRASLKNCSCRLKE